MIEDFTFDDEVDTADLDSESRPASTEANVQIFFNEQYLDVPQIVAEMLKHWDYKIEENAKWLVTLLAQSGYTPTLYDRETNPNGLFSVMSKQNRGTIAGIKFFLLRRYGVTASICKDVFKIVTHTKHGWRIAQVHLDALKK